VDTSIDPQSLRCIRTDFALVLVLFLAHVALLFMMVTAMFLPHSTDGLVLSLVVSAWALTAIALTGWSLGVMLFELKALRQDCDGWTPDRVFGSSVRLKNAPGIRRLAMRLPSLWAPYARSVWWVSTGPCVITDKLPNYRDALQLLGYVEA
jgi:hypothetical protein